MRTRTSVRRGRTARAGPRPDAGGRWPVSRGLRAPSTCVAGARALSVNQIGVDLRVLRPLRREALLGEDRVHRALGLAGAAVDALVGVDEQHAVGAFVEVDAVDGADGHAGDVQDVDAGLGNHVRHGPKALPKCAWLRASRDRLAPQERTTASRRSGLIAEHDPRPPARAAQPRGRRSTAAAARCRGERRRAPPAAPARPSPSASDRGCGSRRTSRPWRTPRPPGPSR